VATQQDIRRRIRSVRNMRRTTKAMELVSGAKLRKAQVRIERLRPFADAMHDLIAEAAGRARVARQPLLERREAQRTALVVCTGDRGLAGAFNASVLRRSLDEGRRLRDEGQEVVWYGVGKRGAASLRFRGITLQESWTGFTDSPVYPDAEQIANRLVTDYVEAKVDRVLMIYNHFDSPLQQTVLVEQVLPVPIDDIEQLSAREIALQGTLLFEPDEEKMLQTLLPTAVETAIFRALLESTASEHGARMTAMRNASDNASDLIDRYTLAMNRARQAEITQSILEVVAGADALE
jgi:F-type H+-transporting ATPase subunit gamma